VVSRWAHNSKVGGSKPLSATFFILRFISRYKGQKKMLIFFVSEFSKQPLILCKNYNINFKEMKIRASIKKMC
jgi:hypothetical protein